MTNRRKSGATGAVRDHAMAGLWGFAEATFFFVVPDVWTSWVGLRRPKRALGSTVSALGGAMAGGAVTYWWSRRVGTTTSRHVMAAIPAITDGMVTEVDQEMAASGPASLMRGPSRGIPYKLYARAAGLQDVSLAKFLGWTVPGRLIRFVVVTSAVSGIAALVRRRFPEVSERRVSTIFWLGWGAFYAVFIPRMSRRK